MRVVDAKELPGLVGQELGVSKWFLIDQPLIERFAELTEDYQWIHVDTERANREIGGTIAHGFLTLSLMTPMMADIVQFNGYQRSINYGCNRLRFTGAVPSGSRVRMRAKLLAVDAQPERIILTRESVVEVEGQDKPALYAEWLTLLVL